MGPEAKAEADAEAYYALYGYYPSWYRTGYYGHGLVYGKRSAVAEPDPEAKAEADAEAYYALYGYYPSWYRGYYGHGLVYGKRSAGAEPEAKADAEAEAHYALYGYYPVGYIAPPSINLYGKRSAEPAADAEPHLYGYGLGYAYRP